MISPVVQQNIVYIPYFAERSKLSWRLTPASTTSLASSAIAAIICDIFPVSEQEVYGDAFGGNGMLARAAMIQFPMIHIHILMQGPR